MNIKLNGWSNKNGRLLKTFKFDTFASAIAYMVKVSLFCEKTDHHPEWKNIYNKLLVELTTHDAGKVTNKDKKLAEYMNKVFDHSSPYQAKK